jgi:hypothetical protein
VSEFQIAVTFIVIAISGGLTFIGAKLQNIADAIREEKERGQ